MPKVTLKSQSQFSSCLVYKRKDVETCLNKKAVYMKRH